MDYSGGIIITDWYAENNNSKEAIKITLRFLSNEIRSDSLKIIVHKRFVMLNLIARLLLNSNLIKNELRSTITILSKAALLRKADKQKN